MSQVRKSPDGFLIPKELLADFENVEVDTSHPHAIVIRSPADKLFPSAEVRSFSFDQKDEALTWVQTS